MQTKKVPIIKFEMNEPWKTEQEDHTAQMVEIEILPPVDITDKRKVEIYNAITEIDEKLDAISAHIEELNAETDSLTNHADGLDYTVAVASGILTGLIDSFFVGQVDLKECRQWGSDKINNFVKKVGGDEDLSKAVANLEKKSKPYFASDPNLNDFGGGKQHHLRDFAHHPTLVGLAFSLLTQFTESCYGTNTAGLFITVPVKDKSRIGDTVTKKIIYGTVYWFFHLVSDMAGTNSTAGGGTGLPGPILSLAKELASIPVFNKMKVNGVDFSKFISKLFNGTLFAQRDSTGKIIKESVVPIDLRTELGVLHKQAFPVVLNEIIVRVFYAARRLVTEIRDKKVSTFSDLEGLNWRDIIPFRNRTIIRMMTIASGTFTAVDIADAAIRSGGFNASCILRINFVGIGRFAIAIGTDIAMGIKKHNKEVERSVALSEYISLANIKIYYRKADLACSLADLYALEASMHTAEQELWQEIQCNYEEMIQLYEQINQTYLFYVQAIEKMDTCSEVMVQALPKFEEQNPGLKEEMLRRLTNGKRRNRSN